MSSQAWYYVGFIGEQALVVLLGQVDQPRYWLILVYDPTISGLLGRTIVEDGYYCWYCVTLGLGWLVSRPVSRLIIVLCIVIVSNLASPGNTIVQVLMIDNNSIVGV